MKKTIFNYILIFLIANSFGLIAQTDQENEKKALKSYEKSLCLDPNNPSAQEMVKNLSKP